MLAFLNGASIWNNYTNFSQDSPRNLLFHRLTAIYATRTCQHEASGAGHDEGQQVPRAAADLVVALQWRELRAQRGVGRRVQHMGDLLTAGQPGGIAHVAAKQAQTGQQAQVQLGRTGSRLKKQTGAWRPLPVAQQGLAKEANTAGQQDGHLCTRGHGLIGDQHVGRKLFFGQEGREVFQRWRDDLAIGQLL